MVDVERSVCLKHAKHDMILAATGRTFFCEGWASESGVPEHGRDEVGEGASVCSLNLATKNTTPEAISAALSDSVTVKLL